MSMYQLFDALAPDEYESLKASIIEVGVRVPIVLCGDTGDIIDGHHRLKICEELKITNYPIEKVYGLTEQAKREMARTLNMERRQLTQAQRREQIRKQLKETPELSDRAIAERFRVTNKTVGAQRKAMVEREEIPHVEKTIDTLGREQPRKIASVINPTKRQERLLKDPAVVERMIADGSASPVIASRKNNKAIKADRKGKPFDLDYNKDVILEVADIRDGLYRRIEENSVDAIITDPPYAKNALELYGELSALASSVLRDGGVLLCMTGNLYLNQVMYELGLHMQYYWTLCVTTPGASGRIAKRRINQNWKPVLVYVKGELKTEDWMPDVYNSPPYDPEDKAYHPHGQNPEIMSQLIEQWSNPGDMILDPFCGGGTVPLCCVQKNRRVTAFDINPEHIETTQQRIKAAFQNPHHEGE